MPEPIWPPPTTPTRSMLTISPSHSNEPRLDRQAGLMLSCLNRSVELALFGRTRQRGGRRRRVDRGGDPVEVTGTNLALVLGCGVTALLGREFALLQLDVGAHLVAGVPVGQIEHRVVEGMEAGQRDELELEAHRPELLLELRDRRVVQVLLPRSEERRV